MNKRIIILLLVFNITILLSLSVLAVHPYQSHLQDSNSITNWLALGGDVVGAALPFATGIGEGVRIASKLGKIDEVADAAKWAVDANKLKGYEKTLRETGEVTVKNFDEANALRKSAFPDATKVPGAGPNTARASESLFKGDNVYRNDFLFDKETGRIYGHGPENPHAYVSHINVKSEQGKFTIIINKIMDFFGK